MSKYRLICPDCGASVITTYPEAAIWELCPGCRRHMWDQYDILMADRDIHDTKDRCGIGQNPDIKM